MHPLARLYAVANFYSYSATSQSSRITYHFEHLALFVLASRCT